MDLSSRAYRTGLADPLFGMIIIWSGRRPYGMTKADQGPVLTLRRFPRLARSVKRILVKHFSEVMFFRLHQLGHGKPMLSLRVLTKLVSHNICGLERDFRFIFARTHIIEVLRHFSYGDGLR
jgi:hypothetical protein